MKRVAKKYLKVWVAFEDDRGQSRDILLSTSIARIIALEYKPNRKE